MSKKKLKKWPSYLIKYSNLANRTPDQKQNQNIFSLLAAELRCEIN